ncbi:hypothetical protein FKM82_017009 [Ascaphus truei]
MQRFSKPLCSIKSQGKEGGREEGGTAGRGARGKRLCSPGIHDQNMNCVSWVKKQTELNGDLILNAISWSLVHLDVTVDVPGYGKVVVDIAYGGAFYAFISAERFGLDVCTSRTRDLVDAAAAVTSSVKAQVKLDHPDSDDLAFLYGTILTDGKEAYSKEPTANICVFADSQVQKHCNILLI